MPKRKRKAPEAKKREEFRWLGFRVPGTDRLTFRNHILILAVLSLVMKFFIAFLTANVFRSFIDAFDILYYLKFALAVLSGQIPYVQFGIDYPQGVFVSILLPLVVVALTGGLPSLLAGNPTGYILLHQGLMSLFDLGSTILVYLIGLSLYGERRAFLAGILSAVAFSSAYFVITKYDAYPTFFLLLALALFISGRRTAGYLASAWGFLVKWFPGLALPLFAVTELKGGADRREILRHLVLSLLVILAFSLPFLVLSPRGLLETYTGRAGYSVLTHGFVYYLDYIAQAIAGVKIFGRVALILTVAAEICLIAWYYRQPRKDPLALTASLFMAVFLFIITNPVASPQYLYWITPFMALFLAGSGGDILLFFAVQAWGYLEFPLLYNGIYDNVTGYGPAGAGFPVAAFLFFTVKFALLFLAFWVIFRRTFGTLQAPEQGAS